MREIGAMLKEEREAKGVSLEDVQRRSRISIRYLEALEEGNFDAIPGEVYVRGFLKRYAESLGIDPELVMERYLRTLKEAQEADAQRESAPVSRGARRRSFKVWPAAVIALTLAAIGFFVARPLLAPRSAGSDNAAPKHAASRPEPRPSALPSIEDAAGSAVDAENQSVSEEGEGGIRESTPTSNSGPSGSPTDAPRTKPVEIQVKLTEGC
jgi:cytoskeletal protein RodZ